LYRIFIDFGTHLHTQKKLVSCKIYFEVHVGKHCIDTFPVDDESE